MDFNKTEAGLISGMACNKLAGMKVTETYHSVLGDDMLYLSSCR